MLEKNLWRWLAKLREEVPGTHIVRIENSAGKGTPDTNCFIPGVGEFWLELKVSTNPLRPEQKAWRRLRERAGARNVYTLRATDHGKTIDDQPVNSRSELLTFLTEQALLFPCPNRTTQEK